MRLPVIGCLASLAWVAPAWPVLADPAPVGIDGMVAHKLDITVADLKALPPTRVHVRFSTAKGQIDATYTGVSLLTLIGRAGLVDAPGKNTALRHTILARGADGYAVSLAFGEIDPGEEGKSVIVAYAADPPAPPLTAPRLIVPGDKHGARSVHELVELEIR